MTFGERKEAIKHFEESRGLIFRHVSYAGIAAAWVLKKETGELSGSLAMAIVLFSFYLALDALYAHRLAIIERKEYLKLEDDFKEKNSRVPRNDEPANYDRSDVSLNACYANCKPLILVLAYICLAIGASDLLTKLWSHMPGACS